MPSAGRGSRHSTTPGWPPPCPRPPGAEYKADQLPFDTIEFADGGKVVRFHRGADDLGLRSGLLRLHQDGTWAHDPKSSDGPGRRDLPASGGGGQGSGRERGPSADSPDGKWTAFVKDNNVFVRGKDGDQEIQLSTDGVEGNAYGLLSWAPDSKTLVALRIEPGDGKEVYLVESSPTGGGRAKFSKRPYALPGDKFTTYELNLFDVESTQADQARGGQAGAGLGDPAPALEEGPAALRL